MNAAPILIASALLATNALGSIADFESQTEGFAGPTLTDNGITFSHLNEFSGVNPDGSNFVPGEYGTDFIVENATLAINDFPSALSGTNALSWGTAFIAGDNLSINIASSFRMSTGSVENYASMSLLIFENGPWGGIELSLQAMREGAVVGMDTIVISDLGGRDNLVGKTLTIDGVEFDELLLAARFEDGTYTAFAGLADNITITPSPSSIALLMMGGIATTRRRRGV